MLDTELETFFDAVERSGRQSALVTSPDARLSPFLDAELRSAETTWILRDGEGNHVDAVTGSRVGEIRYATGPRMVDPSRIPDPTADGLVVEAVVRFRATGGLRLGAVTERIVRALELPVPQVWGHREPLQRPWSVDAVTAAARTAMPEPSLLRATGEIHAWLGVRRTPRGISETTRVLVPPQLLGGPPEAAVDAVTDVLTRQFQVELATLLRFPTSPSGWRIPGRVPQPSPVALVLGPRGVRELRLPDELPDSVEATLVGRQRLPSQLLRFTDRARAWQHLAAIGLPPHMRPASPDRGLLG